MPTLLLLPEPVDAPDARSGGDEPGAPRWYECPLYTSAEGGELVCILMLRTEPDPAVWTARRCYAHC